MVSVKVGVSFETADVCVAEVGSWRSVELHTHGSTCATLRPCSKRQNRAEMKSQANTLICWFWTVWWISLYFKDLLNTGSWRGGKNVARYPSGCNLPVSCFEPPPKHPLASWLHCFLWPSFTWSNPFLLISCATCNCIGPWKLQGPICQPLRLLSMWCSKMVVNDLLWWQFFLSSEQGKLAMRTYLIRLQRNCDFLSLVVFL